MDNANVRLGVAARQDPVLGKYDTQLAYSIRAIFRRIGRIRLTRDCQEHKTMEKGQVLIILLAIIYRSNNKQHLIEQAEIFRSSFEPQGV